MNFKIDDSLAITSESKLFISKDVKNISIKIYGDLIGAVFENKVLKTDKAFNKICEKVSNPSDLKRFIRTVVGKCYIFIKYQNKITIYNSCASPGLFFKKINNNLLYLCEEENDIYQKADLSKINELQVLNSIISHQGLIRMSFSTLFSDIKRSIGGSLIEIKKGLNVNTNLFLQQTAKELKAIKKTDYGKSLKEFSFLIDSTMNLISNFYSKNKIFLAKSGGVDSSVLLASLSKCNETFIPFHIPYTGKNSNSEKTANNLCKIFKKKLNIINSEEKENLINQVKRKSSYGLGMILGAQYLTFNLKDYFSKITNNNHEKIIISGQNLDSLYYLDTFSPGSNEKGMLRFLTIMKTIRKRVYFSNKFLDPTLSKNILRLWPFCVSKKLFNKSIKDYLVSYVTPTAEHIVPFSDATILPYELKDYEQAFIEFKSKEIIDPILNSYKHKNNFLDLSLAQKNHIIRLAKWCRFVQNTHTNYHNSRKSERLNRITPFSEGPMSNFFLTYQLQIKDMFKIKRMCHDYFFQSSNQKFADNVVKIKIFSVKFIFRYIYTILSKTPFASKPVIALKNKFYKSPQDDIYKRTKKILDPIVKNSSFDWSELNMTPQLKKYINSNKENLSNGKVMDKNKLMELCRQVNLENFLENIKN